MLNYLFDLEAISAITRSGSNNFEGSTYFFYRDQALAGKTPLESGSTSTREKLADSAQTYYGKSSVLLKK
jgi:hypothetical protein